MRLKPRENQEVNQWWICDEGRYGYHPIDDGRILKPLERKGKALEDTSWEDGLGILATFLDDLIKENRKQDLGVIVSTHLTNEDLFAVRKFFGDTFGFENVDSHLSVPEGESDDFLRTGDKSPNTRGTVEILHEANSKIHDLVEKAAKGELKALIVFGYDLKALYGEKVCETLVEKLDLFVFIGSNWNGTCDTAHLILPSASYAEKDGTFTNCDGRVQRIRKAFPPLGEAKAEWEILLSAAERLKEPFPYQTPESLMLGLAREIPSFQGLDYQKIGRLGALLKSAPSKSNPVKSVSS